MRKFYVRYEYNMYSLAGSEYSNTIIVLNPDEKANVETFSKKLNDYMRYVKIISWSLIEE